MQIDVIVPKLDFPFIKEQVTQIITKMNFPLACHWQVVEVVNNKSLKPFFINNNTANQNDANPILLIEKNKQQAIVATLCVANLSDTDQADGKSKPIISKVRLDWHKLQRRIVTAGRKSELLLQACKLTAESQVLDATAGFGHDSLIMASSGATVIMLENNPLMALLLLLERERMQNEKNWQGLMARLLIYHDNMLNLQTDNMVNAKFDVVYLDPMFPNDSYAGAKVGKGMQVLHNLATPPTLAEEKALLSQAKSRLKKGGRVIVKRPKNAPYLAKITADESWANDVVRFDGYFC